VERRSHLLFAAALAALTAGVLGARDLLPLFTAMSLLGALIPDFDLGFRHRMLLHNVFIGAALAGLPLLAGVFLPVFPASMLWGLPLGFASHIFLDMATFQGVALFYPLSRRRFRYARLRSTSRLANLAVEAISTLIFLYALMLNYA